MVDNVHNALLPYPHLPQQPDWVESGRQLGNSVTHLLRCSGIREQPLAGRGRRMVTLADTGTIAPLRRQLERGLEEVHEQSRRRVEPGGLVVSHSVVYELWLPLVAVDKQPAAARPSAVAAADRLPTATRGSQSSYTTSGDITSKSQVSRLCAEIDERVGAFLERPIEGRWPYLWLDATYLKVRRAGHIVPVAATVAVAVNTEGRRDMVAAAIRTAFIQEDHAAASAQWRQVADTLRPASRPSPGSWTRPSPTCSPS